MVKCGKFCGHDGEMIEECRNTIWKKGNNIRETMKNHGGVMCKNIGTLEHVGNQCEACKLMVVQSEKR